MLARGLLAIASAAPRILLWAAHSAFVAMVTASWIAAKPVSAEVPPGEALGTPRTTAAENQKSGSAEGGAWMDEGGPALGPPAPRSAGPSSGDPEARGDAATTGRVRININRAPARKLQRLPGIGEAISERIVTWREQNQDFGRIADLRRVPGIGPKTLADLRPYIAVSGPTTSPAPDSDGSGAPR